MSEELFDDGFTEYRSKEMLEGVQVLKELERGNVSVEYYLGAMKMLRRIIDLPKKMVKLGDKDQQLSADEKIREALNLFERLMIRQTILDGPTVPVKGRD